jgi:hypothetical protein
MLQVNVGRERQNADAILHAVNACCRHLFTTGMKGKVGNKKSFSSSDLPCSVPSDYY